VGETVVRLLALVVAIALALVVAGCMTNKPAIGDAKTGDGTVLRTHQIEI
jgi:hypothetical protein